MNNLAARPLNSLPKLSRWYRRYRVVKDKFLGYQAQVWRAWWPFWCTVGFSNTNRTIEEAYGVCEAHANPTSRLVRYF